MRGSMSYTHAWTYGSIVSGGGDKTLAAIAVVFDEDVRKVMVVDVNVDVVWLELGLGLWLPVQKPFHATRRLVRKVSHQMFCARSYCNINWFFRLRKRSCRRKCQEDLCYNDWGPTQQPLRSRHELRTTPVPTTEEEQFLVVRLCSGGSYELKWTSKMWARP